MDNANTEKYEGYEFLTSLMLGYEQGPHKLALNVENLFDQRYAAEVRKNTTGTKTYYAGAPRTCRAQLQLSILIEVHRYETEHQAPYFSGRILPVGCCRRSGSTGGYPAPRRAASALRQPVHRHLLNTSTTAVDQSSWCSA